MDGILKSALSDLILMIQENFSWAASRLFYARWDDVNKREDRNGLAAESALFFQNPELSTVWCYRRRGKKYSRITTYLVLVFHYPYSTIAAYFSSTI